MPKRGSNQLPEGSVICPSCRHTFLSFVKCELKMDDRLDFQMELFENNNEESVLVSQSFTSQNNQPLSARYKQDEVIKSCTVECPQCPQGPQGPKTFVLSIHLIKTTEESRLDLKLSITTCEGEKKEKKEKEKEKIKAPSGQKGPSEKTGQQVGLPTVRPRVKVSYKCSGETFRVDDQIKKQLTDKRRTLHVHETNLEDSDIVIVFCPITSRVGSNVDSTMSDETVSSLRKPIILVLMHHTRDLDYSTAGKIWSEVYPYVVLDVHVLFHETKPGLLICRQNEEAFEMIKKELHKHSKIPRGMLTNRQTRGEC